MKRFHLGAVLFFMLGCFVPLCQAGQYDFKEITPEISAALKGRQARFSELQRLKQTGAVGEGNQGYVASLGGGQSLVAQENRDREVIYRGLVEQNRLGPNGLREVQRVFAEVQRDKAGSGEMVQLPSGAWTRK
ncbi:MAG: YdbL family protein [Candidatus Omnitrophica bacterium]|nr:YdbL family protein [Candidatus Omnitrophota bacterium]